MAVRELKQILTNAGNDWAKKNNYGKITKVTLSHGPHGAANSAWVDVLDAHVTYPDDPVSSFVPSNGAEQEVENNSSVEQNSEVTLMHKTTNTVTWTFHAGLEIGASATIEAGVPLFAKGRMSVTTKLSLDATRAATETEENTWSVHQVVKAPPRTKVSARLVIDQQRYSMPFYAYGTLSGWIGYEYSKGTKYNSRDLSSIFRQYPVPEFTPLRAPEVQYRQEGTHEGLVGVRCRVEFTEQPLDDPAAGRTYFVEPIPSAVNVIRAETINT